MQATPPAAVQRMQEPAGGILPAPHALRADGVSSGAVEDRRGRVEIGIAGQGHRAPIDKELIGVDRPRHLDPKDPVPPGTPLECVEDKTAAEHHWRLAVATIDDRRCLRPRILRGKDQRRIEPVDTAGDLHGDGLPPPRRMRPHRRLRPVEGGKWMLAGSAVGIIAAGAHPQLHRRRSGRNRRPEQPHQTDPYASHWQFALWIQVEF